MKNLEENRMETKTYYPRLAGSTDGGHNDNQHRVCLYNTKYVVCV